MSQKSKILHILADRPNKSATRGELAQAIYGDNIHGSAIFSALTALVQSGEVTKTGSYPAVYTLAGGQAIMPPQRQSTLARTPRSNNRRTYLSVTNELIEQAHLHIRQTANYGRENDLITDAFTRFPLNTDLTVVAMKAGLIDITNSTNISRYKSKISVVELAECIVHINNIDARIEAGDPEVVNEIARSNGRINLFSFASKYCCYHNKNLYGKDDYSILDTVVKDSLPKYFDDITKNQIIYWQKHYMYKEYNDYITRKLDELGITTEYRKRKFDHFVWLNNR